MSLEVDRPDPPELTPQRPADDDVADRTDDYRREELQAFLEEGAWAEAFAEWAETTELTEREFEIARDLDLFAEFDFFWDDFADRVGYHAPGLPEDWRERDLHPDLETWESVSSINASLTELGQIVCETLKAEYIDWESEFEGPEDLPEFE